MGFPPGPLYRDILEALLEARLNKLVTSREEEEAFVLERFEPARDLIRSERALP